MDSSVNSKPIITAENFYYRYPRTSDPVLKDISLKVSSGEFIGVVGPTGAGKTTLCLALCGLIPKVLGGRTKGKILINGVDTSENLLEDLLFSKDDRTALTGITFQDPEAQLVGLSVEEDLAFGPENLGLPPLELRRRVDEVLELIRMTEFRDVFPYKLSGGQKQRVAIGSMLALRPKVLVLDEPASELDPIGRNEVFSVIKQLKEEANLSIIVVEHHTEMLARFCDRVWVIDEGELVLDDRVDAVFEQVDLLRSVGVRPPEGVELLKRLQEGGVIQGDKHCMTSDEAIHYLREVIRKGGND